MAIAASADVGRPKAPFQDNNIKTTLGWRMCFLRAAPLPAALVRTAFPSPATLATGERRNGGRGVLDGLVLGWTVA